MYKQALDYYPNQELTNDSDLDFFVGRISDLPDPFNVFARVNDLENPYINYVYFYVYSLGKKKEFLWGIYDKTSKEIFIDDACKYDPRLLSTTLAIWKKGKFKYIFNSVKDRFSKKIQKLVEEVENFPKFRHDYLMLKAADPYTPIILAGITQADVEAYMDLNDLNEDDIINKLVLIKRKIPKFAKDLFLYLEDEDYVTAKYLLKLYSNDSDLTPEIIKRLRQKTEGTFMDLFLHDLILNNSKLPINIDEKQYEHLVEQYLKPQIDIYEASLNRTDIDPRLGLNKNALNILKNLSKSFQDWISRSIYNNEAFTKNLHDCPSPEKCEDNLISVREECGLYNHGISMPSRYDEDLC